jgi:hypothetical protein
MPHALCALPLTRNLYPACPMEFIFLSIPSGLNAPSYLTGP